MIGWIRSAFAKREPGEAERHDGRSWDLSPDDRIGQLPKRPKARSVERRLVLIGVATGATLLGYQDPTVLPRALSLLSSLASQLLASELVRAATPRPLPEQAKRIADAPLSARQPDPAPSMDAGQGPVASNAPANALSSQPTGTIIEAPVKHLQAANLPPTSAGIPYVAPELVTVDDPFVVKAKAAGLHPDLSRALLIELTDTDYRNARVATETALGKTADDAVFRWPPKREPGLAMFEVRFVPGAGDMCRRYIVTIEKKRWTTTSLPIERCGFDPIRRRADIRARH